MPEILTSPDRGPSRFDWMHKAGQLETERDNWRSIAQERERELARYKRLEALLRNEADVEDKPDCGDEQIVRPNAAMRLLAEWEGK